METKCETMERKSGNKMKKVKLKSGNKTWKHLKKATSKQWKPKHKSPPHSLPKRRNPPGRTPVSPFPRRTQDIGHFLAVIDGFHAVRQHAVIDPRPHDRVHLRGNRAPRAPVVQHVLQQQALATEGLRHRPRQRAQKPRQRRRQLSAQPLPRTPRESLPARRGTAGN